jgi:type II secretory pathway pseudopilin PulG
MMNMARQQEAAERQTALAQQTMDINKAQEARAAALQGPALTKAQQDNIVQALSIFREAVGDIAEGDVTAAEAVRADLVARVPGFDKFLPPASTWDRNTRNRLMLTSEKEIEKTIATPVASLQLTPDNQGVSVTVGGMAPGGELLNTGRAQGAATAPPRATPTTPPASAMDRSPSAASDAPMTFGTDAERPLNAYQQEDLRNLQSELGMSNTPASFTRGGMAAQMTPDVMSRIVDSAFQTGVMAQVDFDQLLASQPPQNKQALMDAFRQAKITLQADAPSLADSAMGQQQSFAANPVQRPQAGFADFRGPAPQISNADLGGQPMMRQTQLGAGQPLILKTPTPPSANVAPQVLGSQRAAETAGSENVKVGTEPRIVAGTERAKRLENLRGEMPRALSETQVLVNNLTGRIEAIDEFLRSGSRNSIIGAIEGRIPRALQSETRADAQALYDYITSNQVLQKLIDDRAQTETGASPQGVVSDRDLAVAVQAATKLTQTGTERKQEIEMQRLRDVLYRAREQALQKYGDVYREVIKEAPELRLKIKPVAPKYKSSPQTPTRAKSLENIFGG